ncbi:preprotein translocase subunit SecE [Aeoliella mucimassa]|uniref:Protein translocase subunit SecE n=1 Tax=Aeoliella mucimassa TaxID=2527972 RepID=A0A518ATZ0_9BACT|nr:preprotein translocase subunit SecE [Aeoliella mucimassa]QDU58165.1 preprotein translocase subunit SecE [Aeoliella mucimassa]
MGAYLQELFKFNLYKRTQGRVVRQLTFAACAIIVALGCWSLSGELQSIDSQPVRYLLPFGLLLAGVWACFRLIQMPQFADFLISVEAEMNKVAWPKRRELINATIVVIAVIFLLAILLFSFDFILQALKAGAEGLIKKDTVDAATELAK